jgi:hypothetical protein
VVTGLRACRACAARPGRRARPRRRAARAGSRAGLPPRELQRERLPVWGGAFVLIALLLTSCETAPRPRPADPLFLNAASQDGALYLTWNAAPDTRRMTLHWRPVGAHDWQTAEADDRGYYLLEGLENGRAYESYAERELPSGRRVTSDRVAQTPRTRRFDWNPLLFTNQAAADEWLRKSGVDPASLHLLGRADETWKPGARDGAYATADRQFLLYLHRYMDELFAPPAAPRSAADVRAVLKRVLWPNDNPFDDPERFPMTIAPIDPPLLGAVRDFASADSFAIAYHPGLSSRCTRFVPRHPAPGKIAIYLHGHQGTTVRHGAHTIGRLLQRGWQVIAMDMPLTGANRSDATKALRSHDSFLLWQSEDFAPTSLFVQPLKALVDQIYRDHPDDPSLTVMLIGISGGGWTSFMYGALDPRVHYVASIAGGMPLSMRLRETPTRIGDYEQSVPQIYEVVPYEHIMPAAGSRGAFYAYNEHDPCCFRLTPDEPFVRYLEDASLLLYKPIEVFVDTATTRHAFSDAAFAELDRFVETTELWLKNGRFDGRP